EQRQLDELLVTEPLRPRALDARQQLLQLAPGRLTFAAELRRAQLEARVRRHTSSRRRISRYSWISDGATACGTASRACTPSRRSSRWTRSRSRASPCTTTAALSDSSEAGGRCADRSSSGSRIDTNTITWRRTRRPTFSIMSWALTVS